MTLTFNRQFRFSIETNRQKVGIFESGILENREKQGKTEVKVGVFESKWYFCLKTDPRACGF